MDGSDGGSCSSSVPLPPPFLSKTYEMVDDPMTNSLVSWSETGCSFIVWNPPDFSRDLLPKYFKHNNFSSFVRQLNTYGFRKIDPEQWEFANEEFIRGQKHLMTKIHRRKPIHSHSVYNNQGKDVPLTDIERRELEQEIGRLNNDKNRLRLELQRHQIENQKLQFQVQVLSERFQNLENRQGQLMTFLGQQLQKPEFAIFPGRQSEIHDHKRRRLLKFIQGDHQRLTSQSGNLLLKLEQIEKLESSIKFWETFLLGVSETLVKEVQPPPIIVAEMQASSGDSELCSSTPYQLTDVNSSPELGGPVYHVNGLPASSFVDIMPKSSTIDINSKQATVSESFRETELQTTDHPLPMKVNDHFWERFLTEAPDSSDA
ncbi:hypothetical protein SLE2022_117340 [Rubroshorea leprosula]